jgi:hypothetical protein
MQCTTTTRPGAALELFNRHGKHLLLGGNILKNMTE